MTDTFNQRIRAAIAAGDKGAVLRTVAENPTGIDQHTAGLLKQFSAPKKIGRPRKLMAPDLELVRGKEIYQFWQAENCPKTKAIENYATDHHVGTDNVRRDLNTFCGAVERIIAAVEEHWKITGKRPFDIDELWDTDPEDLWIWTCDPGDWDLWLGDYDLIMRWLPLLDHLLPSEENWDWDYGPHPLYDPEFGMPPYEPKN